MRVEMNMKHETYIDYHPIVANWTIFKVYISFFNKQQFFFYIEYRTETRGIVHIQTGTSPKFTILYTSSLHWIF